MASAKDLIVKPISASDANRIVKSIHYSGKVVKNSQVHLGVFLNGRCGGAMQFGPSLDKRKIQPLVKGTLWNEFIELNRMAFADWLPRNGESRCIGYAMRWMRKTYPQIKWVVSFADGAQCGDGTIYRASGFVLTGIKENNQIWHAPTGERFSRTSLTDGRSKQQQQQQAKKVVSRSSMTMKGKNGGGQIRKDIAARDGMVETGAASMKQFEQAGWQPIPGFQLRYLYFIDPTARERLTVPIIPFSEIQRRGAGMYRGKPRAGSADSGTPGIHSGGGGATPTPALLSETPR